MLSAAAAVSAAPSAAVSTAAIAAAEAGLGDKDFRVRRGALSSLEGVNDARKLKLLEKSLNDEDPAIREKSARLIGRSRDKTAYKLLTDRLKDKDTEVCLNALEGLRELGDKRAAVPVAALLARPERNLRWKAAEVLGSLRSDNGVTALGKAAREDKDESVRIAALESLGKINSASSRVALNAIKAGADKRLAGWADNVLKAAGKVPASR